MTSGSLTEYMVKQADEFNIRVDMVEQKMTSIDEKLSAMEYNIDRLVNQLEVLLNNLPYNKPTGGDETYEKYIRKE